MKQLLAFILLGSGIAMISCQTTKSTDETTAADTTATATATPTLTKKWETDSVLTTCESVIYDQANEVLYVANINGVPDKKDGNGFISKVNLDGQVTELNWIKGMDAPKGMGIANGKLYVTDIDRIHEIDIAASKITKTHKAEGALFLNDIATDIAGKVYVSDTGAGVVYLIENGSLTKWLENIQSPNGLLVDNNQLFILGFESKALSSVDLTTKQVTLKVDSIDNGDGIEPVGDGGYLASSWNGMVHYVSPEWKSTMLLNTTAEQVNAADIEYIADKKLLLVPAFFKNKVVAYEFSK